MSRDLFVDATVLLLAVGGPSPQRDDCRALVAAAGAGQVSLHVSAEGIQEFLWHRLRRVERTTAISETQDVLDLVTVHDVTAASIDDMLGLVQDTDLRGRDALHAAVARAAGFAEIVTTDDDFASVPGLRAVAPEALEL